MRKYQARFGGGLTEKEQQCHLAGSLPYTSNGRKAALDMRLVQPDAPDLPTAKINVLVNAVADIWRASAPRKGAQLIFCDLGIPKRSTTSESPDAGEMSDTAEDDATRALDDPADMRLLNDVYSEVRRKLVRAGIPSGEIAFIHDCKSPAQRSALFAAVREGRSRVLIGSTDKMGTGMNCQSRLIALHHLSVPWRPSDLAQREGRILRQGNGYPEVLIFNYVTEGSFDGYLWQVLESKARFISQIMAGEITARTVEDVSDTVLTMAEVKALASGNPKVMEKVTLETELARLSHLYAAWRSAQSSMRWELDSLPARIKTAEAAIDFHARAMALRDGSDTALPFVIQLRPSLDGDAVIAFDRREDAGKHLRRLAEMGYQKARHGREATLGSHCIFEVGVYKGFRLFLKSFAHESMAPELWPALGNDMAQANAATIGDSDLGAIQSLDAQLRGIDRKLQDARQARQVLAAKEQSLREEIAKPWELTDRYARLKHQLAILNVALQKAGLDLSSGVALPDVPAAAQFEGAATPADTDQPEYNFSMSDILAWLHEMHAGQWVDAGLTVTEPAVVSAPETEIPAPVIDEAMVEAMEREIEQRQAQLVFGQMVLETTKRRRKIAVEPPETQIGFGW